MPSSLACPEPPTEPRDFWLPESPEACEAENCGDPDHSKLCKTCGARLCPEHAKRCECDSYHCETCLFAFQDMRLCYPCLTREEAKQQMSAAIETLATAIKALSASGCLVGGLVVELGHLKEELNRMAA